MRAIANPLSGCSTLRQLILAGRPYFPQQGCFVLSLAGFPEGGVQLLDEDMTIPIISDPDDGIAMLNLKEAWCRKLEFAVTGRGNER
ncbi:hypothetical protein SB2_20565 [Methylobacterium radiotolerans]|nr:hypothetical protein SB3_12925 [Methylobacterium radiotolerans]KTS45542.1 hypothetical protein SB2_20565 [Methylobacterium radiotolerans]